MTRHGGFESRSRQRALGRLQQAGTRPSCRLGPLGLFEGDQTSDKSIRSHLCVYDRAAATVAQAETMEVGLAAKRVRGSGC
ncbi:hypothetical protein AAFF_G00423380 [Aldrovandia affinis]|uniref:Uncharacterized protein n=1 Tax=Aldrovandia affinis TaxID=143900 RepID=A0AAD7T717_9TELE|nr:hypothetical protein AAFF_G00423380 [Aldrovandia affinis]